MKEVLLAVTADLVVNKANKPSASYTGANIRVCKVTKDESVSFKVEADSEGTKVLPFTLYCILIPTNSTLSNI